MLTRRPKLHNKWGSRRQQLRPAELLLLRKLRPPAEQPPWVLSPTRERSGACGKLSPLDGVREQDQGSSEGETDRAAQLPP